MEVINQIYVNGHLVPYFKDFDNNNKEINIQKKKLVKKYLKTELGVKI